MIYLGQHPTNPGDFIGRESMIDEIYSHLQYSHFIEIIGPTLSGKTSLAHFIRQSEKIDTANIVFFDLQRTQGNLSIAKAMANQAHEVRKILIIDEVDVVCAQIESFFDWSRLLRALGDPKCNVSTILIGQSSYDVYCHRYELRESRARGNPIYMQPPHHSACRQLALNVLSEGGIPSPEKQDIDFIEQLAGSHPYLIEIVAQLLIAYHRKREKPRYEDIITRVLFQCKPFFFDLFRFACEESDSIDPAIAILYCAAIANASEVSKSEAYSSDSERLRNLLENLDYSIEESLLFKTGIITTHSNIVRPFSPVMTRFILQCATEDRLRAKEDLLLHVLEEDSLASVVELAKKRLGLIKKVNMKLSAS